MEEESEAEDLGWEEGETGYRAVYITHGSARQSSSTTYPSVKKRVVSQNFRSLSVHPDTPNNYFIFIIIIIFSLTNKSRSHAHGHPLRYPHTQLLRFEFSTKSRS